MLTANVTQMETEPEPCVCCGEDLPIGVEGISACPDGCATASAPVASDDQDSDRADIAKAMSFGWMPEPTFAWAVDEYITDDAVEAREFLASL